MLSEQIKIDEDKNIILTRRRNKGLERVDKIKHASISFLNLLFARQRREDEVHLEE